MKNCNLIFFKDIYRFMLTCFLVPEQPTFLKVIKVDKDTATLSWGLPKKLNGNLTGYLLQYQISKYKFELDLPVVFYFSVEYLVYYAENLMIIVCRLAHFLIAERSVNWLTDQIQATACSYKESFIGTQLCPLKVGYRCFLTTMAEKLQQRLHGPRSLKYLQSSPFQKGLLIPVLEEKQ